MEAVAICVPIIDTAPPCEASIDAGALVMALLTQKLSSRQHIEAVSISVAIIGIGPPCEASIDAGALVMALSAQELSSHQILMQLLSV